MSYLVLARKWRPGNFAETVGQEHVLKALTNALETERLHHAYLFAGTRGVGKTTIARILAKALNCDTGITAEPCGECAACTEIDEGRFVDLIEVDAASKTKVDDTRDLLDNVQYAPARGRFKVYLIDEVHMLSKNSFNALLKTLEEPPSHVKFLLATTDPQKLPVTVLSRCLQFNLKRLTPTLIRERLELICNEESVNAEPAALAMIARAADGSLRDALSLLDQAIAFCGGEVAESPVAEMLGTIDQQHVSRLLHLLADGDAGGMMSVVGELDEQFPDYARLLDDLARMMQRIAVFQVVGSFESEGPWDDAEIAKLADSIGQEDVQLFYQIAVTGRRDLYLAPDPRSGVEMTLLRMLAFRPGGTVRQQTEVKEKSATRLSAVPVASKVESPATQVPASAATWQEPDFWRELLPRLDLTAVSRQLASNCAYLRREDDTVYFSLDSRSESYLTREREQKLAAALSKHFGEKLKVNIAVGEVEKETPVQIEKRMEVEEIDAARAGLEADPNVQALKDMFGAELVADSVEPLSDK
ncbi:MAG: DNA polymerase III subunit gamma/tau [Woeseiaceae bacterium]|nr:DNA polymerase III subunit gamma/tau [Woeseiaceae bacterium]